MQDVNYKKMIVIPYPTIWDNLTDIGKKAWTDEYLKPQIAQLEGTTGKHCTVKPAMENGRLCFCIQEKI